LHRRTARRRWCCRGVTSSGDPPNAAYRYFADRPALPACACAQAQQALRLGVKAELLRVVSGRHVPAPGRTHRQSRPVGDGQHDAPSLVGPQRRPTPDPGWMRSNRASQEGIHQFQSPNKDTRAGTSTDLTTVASSRIPNPRAVANTLMSVPGRLPARGRRGTGSGRRWGSAARSGLCLPRRPCPSRLGPRTPRVCGRG